jgi:urease accessory protein
MERRRGADPVNAMATSSVAAHLAALQLADSQFPAGLYNQSFGLEAYVDAGVVVTPADVDWFCEELVAASVAPTDAVAAAGAWRAAAAGGAADAVAVDVRLDAAKPVAAQRDASRRAGRALLAVAERLDVTSAVAAYRCEVEADAAPGHHAAAMGAVAHAQGVALAETVAAELHATVTAALGAGLRLGLVDHLQAQATAHRLRHRLAGLTERALATPVDELGGWTPGLDAAAASHQHADRRLFAT